MIDKSETINELAAALAKAQAAFTHVKKDKTARIEMKAGGAYTYRYADLGSTWDVARKALTDNGLSVVQAPSFADGWIELTTMLLHSSGQYVSSAMKTRASENDVKSLGSAITYLRRYAFSAMTGLVADEDDDGDGSNAGQQRAPRQAAPRAPLASERPAPAPATNGNESPRAQKIARVAALLNDATKAGVKIALDKPLVKQSDAELDITINAVEIKLGKTAGAVDLSDEWNAIDEAAEAHHG